MAAGSYLNERLKAAYATITAYFDRTPWALPALACLAVVLARIRSAPGVDVSVLITWAERMVDGARPFIDFVEVNPPGSVLLYVPAVVVSRLTGLSPEVSSELLQCALIALSLTLCWRVLASARLLDGHQRYHLLAAVIAIIGVMPAVAFGQREHVGIIAALPILAITAAESTGYLAARWLRLAGGMLAGLSMIAKPHFALIYVAVALFGIVSTRKFWLVFRIQWIAAGATLATYVGLTYWAYPTFYSTHLPKIAEVYLGWRVGILGMVGNPVLLIFAVAFIMLRRQYFARQLETPTQLIALCGLVGALLFFLQARGWPYHALPGLTLIAMAVAWEATRNVTAEPATALPNLAMPNLAMPAPTRCYMLAALAMIFAATFVWSDKDHDRHLDQIAAVVNRTHPNPRMLTIAEDISIGHPLVRQVKGTWTHQVTHLWTAFGVYLQIGRDDTMPAEKRARLIAYLKAEIDDLAASIEREKPDIIVVQRGWRKNKDVDWMDWAQKWPVLTRQLADYSSVTRIDDVEILKRNVIATPPRKIQTQATRITARAP